MHKSPYKIIDYNPVVFENVSLTSHFLFFQ